MIIKLSYSNRYTQGILKDDFHSLSAEGWKSVMVQWESAKLQDFFTNHCYTAFSLLNGKKKDKYCISTNVYVMDVDDGFDFDSCKNYLEAKGFAFALITTASHQILKKGIKADRYRVIVPLARDITKKEWDIMNDYFQVLLPVRDNNATNASRYFFVSPLASQFYLSQSTKVFDPNSIPSVLKYKIKEMENNEITFEDTLLVTMEDGMEIEVKNLNIPSDDSTYKCECPFHTDEHASAFISRTKTGRYMIACSACKAENRQSTFWCSNNTISEKDSVQLFFDHKQGKPVVVLDILPEEVLKNKEIDAIKWFYTEKDFANYGAQYLELRSPQQLKEYELSLPRYAFIFNPSKPAGIKLSNTKHIPGIYNRFRSSPYLDITTTSKQVFSSQTFEKNAPYTYALLHNLFGKSEYMHYYLNFLASVIQTRQKPHTAFIISTNVGAGKETLYRCILKPIFNPYHTISLSIDDILKEFNGFDFDKWCVIYDEAQGSRFFEETAFASKLNTMVTCEENKIRELYQSPVFVKDYRFFTVFSNSEKPLPIPDDDRRFVVIRNRDSINMMKIALYKKLTPEEDWQKIADKIAEELPLFAKFLQELQVNSLWLTKAPLTDAKTEMIDSLRTPMQRLAEAVFLGNPEDIDGWFSVKFPSEEVQWKYNVVSGRNESTSDNFDRVSCSEAIENHYIPGRFVDTIIKAVNNNTNKGTRQEFQEFFRRDREASGIKWYPKKYKEI